MTNHPRQLTDARRAIARSRSTMSTAEPKKAGATFGNIPDSACFWRIYMLGVG